LVWASNGEKVLSLNFDFNDKNSFFAVKSGCLKLEQSRLIIDLAYLPESYGKSLK
jgi:hypothetical protein